MRRPGWSWRRRGLSPMSPRCTVADSPAGPRPPVPPSIEGGRHWPRPPAHIGPTDRSLRSPRPWAYRRPPRSAAAPHGSAHGPAIVDPSGLGLIQPGLEDDIVADRVGMGLDMAGGVGRGGVGVHPDIAEVGAEPCFHRRAGRRVRRCAPRPSHHVQHR